LARWSRRASVGVAALALLASSPRAQPPQAPLSPPAPAASVAPTPPAPPPVDLSAITLRPDQIALLQHTLAQAAGHGLRADAFALAPDAGKADLIDAVLRYAIAVHVGQLPTSGFLAEWGLRPPAYDPAPDFAEAVAADRLGPWLDSLPPPYPGYDALKAALDQYRHIAAKGGWRTIADGLPVLKLGVTDRRVLALRARLAIEDPTVAASGPPVFDARLAAAVAKAQKRYGLDPDGVVKAATLAALNVPVAARIDQIVANMERWRWLPPALPADRIQVNIAAAVLTLFQADTPVMSMKAVTGRPGDETPMLQSQIFSVVFNPPWNVPSTIATKELWPKERAHPGYLARNDFRVIQNDDGSVRLQQRAGPKAALGHVKFDFLNPYGVYLHDTPSHGGFAKFTRQESHGCVRLERPVALAKALMDGDPKWTPEAIDQAIAAGTTTVRAAIPKPIAVFLLYWTAFVGADGAANFRADPYGWDNVLMQRIAAGGTSGA
jgi:murein L,D-transpeptidase YcbB/YkuD